MRIRPARDVARSIDAGRAGLEKAVDGNSAIELIETERSRARTSGMASRSRTMMMSRRKKERTEVLLSAYVDDELAVPYRRLRRELAAQTSRALIPRAAENFHFFADLAPRLTGEFFPVEGDCLAAVRPVAPSAHFLILPLGAHRLLLLQEESLCWRALRFWLQALLPLQE